MIERAVVFRVAGEELPGILHPGAPDATAGVAIVVGGPQYRVGSHRQFVLLARELSRHGIPVFRFDYRGMGDAGGAERTFEAVGEDIRAAIDTFVTMSPAVREVVLWGLCDAASAILDYAWQDPRVGRLVLLNPWVRTEAGIAKAYLRHYYLRRITSAAFWSGLLRGQVDFRASLRSLTGLVARAVGAGPGQGRTADSVASASAPLPIRMADGWRRFGGPIMLILSGDDLTADEFRDVVRTVPAWKGLLEHPRVAVRELPEANHTFSRRTWRDQVARWTLEGLG